MIKIYHIGAAKQITFEKTRHGGETELSYC